MIKANILKRVLSAGEDLLLDIYPGATAAYSFRLLRSDYSGSCIRVRRSSDNAQQDIGFNQGVMDTSSLLSFVGGGDGFIIRHYDQSGNGSDIIQTTTSEQPKIVNSGSVILDNSKPTIDFSTAHYLENEFNPYSTDITVFMVLSATMPQDAVVAEFGQGGGGDLLAIGIGNLNSSSVYSSRFRVSGSRNKSGEDADSSQSLLSVIGIESPESSQLYYNGSAGTKSYESRSNSNATGVTVGALDSGALGSTIKMSELIIYDSDQSSSRVDIETNINNYYGVY